MSGTQMAVIRDPLNIGRNWPKAVTRKFDYCSDTIHHGQHHAISDVTA
jgi:hypothetical protein